MCTYSLDHITPSRLGTTWLTLNYFALASRHVRSADKPLIRSLRPRLSKNTVPASMPDPFQNRVRLSFSAPAATATTVVGLGGLEPPTSPLSGARSNHLSYRPVARRCPRWWSQSGSNRRPPACKAGALPAELWPRLSPWGQTPSQAGGHILKAGNLCGRLRNEGRHCSKGGDPAAPSDTATLLRLHPSHRPHRGKRPPCG